MVIFLAEVPAMLIVMDLLGITSFSSLALDRLNCRLPMPGASFELYGRVCEFLCFPTLVLELLCA